MRDEDIQFVSVQAPADQVVRYSDVQPDSVKSSWRGALDQFPLPDVLEREVITLLDKEFENFFLTSKQGERSGLVTLKSRKEGEKIADVTCIQFTTITNAREFLSQGR